ncbi:MAG: Imidazole glycerol phosphate synthase subunit HisH 1 [Pseudomonadota bacterium]
MSRVSVGLVDYDVGNLASVARMLERLDFHCRIGSDAAVLARADVLLLPGVGAFGAAMCSLEARGLTGFLRDAVRAGTPIVGLCLGMQLLADASLEFGRTPGLGLIPGEVVPLPQGARHIGWNSIDVVGADELLAPSDGAVVYFNHSYVFVTDSEYRTCTATLGQPFTAGVRRGNVVGLQFHPEKSQEAGRALLRHVIEGVVGA